MKSTCHLGKQHVPTDDTLWISRLFVNGTEANDRVGVCTNCKDEFISKLTDKEKRWIPGQFTFMKPKRCYTCGRMVCYAMKEIKATTRYNVCSWKCRYDAVNKTFRETHRTIKVELTCTVCNKSFIPPRNDAVTCSSACRQKAYRLRKAA
jgi:hypothetical protein